MDFRRIGPYVLDHEIGAGGMGTVYYGTHEGTGQPAAVKVLPASLAREPGFLARFHREISALQKLDSPYIVKLFEHGQEGDVPWYSMEFVEGETVSERVSREKRIPWREVVDLGVQMCAALKAAHNAGIIHRDLKPSNLIVSPDGQAKLTDFGVAQVFAGGKLTATGGVLGTAEYMPPEQAEGRRVTKQSDIYSLGAVLYVMLTGRPPFPGKTVLEILRKVRTAGFDSPRLIVPEVPRWLDDVICQCLEKQPEDRYPDAYVLARRLQEIPKLVQLAEGDDEARHLTAATEETAVEGAGTAGPGESGEKVGATLMRDLMRAEVEDQQRKSAVGRWLDNTWVLLALLVLVIVGGMLWFEARQPDPAALFAAGTQLMEAPPGDDWERAKSEYFEPLVQLDPDEWAPRVEPYLRQIELYELADSTRGPRLGRRTPQTTETGQFLARALAAAEGGKPEEARRLLHALRTVLEGEPDSEASIAVVDGLLDDLPEPSTRSLLSRTMQRANELEQQGDIDEARQLWQSVIELYGADPGAQEAVQTARAKLRGAIAEANGSE